MSKEKTSTLPWHPIPSSPANAICKVYLIQAGGLSIATDLVLLPGPDEPNDSVHPDKEGKKSERFYVPNFVFLVEHVPSHNHYIFDLGIRKDVENLAPILVKNVLPNFDLDPVDPAEVLKRHGTPEQQPENIKAVIFSHVHFDHVGDGAKTGFTNAELWLGPTFCSNARPGYPVDEHAPVLTDNFPPDGSRKIVEAFVSDTLLEKSNDKRAGKVQAAKAKGLYKAVELRDPGDEGWIGLGAFDRGFDVFGDGSAYLIDAPGHCPGHQMMLVRVKTGGPEDDFVLLAGDCYHHPALLKDPRRTARPPYARDSVHSEPEEAMVTMSRTKSLSERDNIWILGAHDPSVGEAIAPMAKEIEGLVLLNDWREKKWKEA